MGSLGDPISGIDACFRRVRPTDRSWWFEQTPLSPGVSDIVWPQLWRALKVNAPEIASHREFSSGRLSRLSKFCLPSRIGYSLLMRRQLADTSRGRALRRRIIAAIKPDE